LLMAGVLAVQSYFDATTTVETEIRALADTLYRAVDWRWAMNNGSLLSLGWSPESGFEPYTWQGYNEAMILYLLAIGSPEADKKLEGSVWNQWCSTYQYATFQGYAMVNFSPLFGHQYSHVWIDFAGIKDAYMRSQPGLDYFENSRRATLANRAYCVANPSGYKGYSATLWGLTACDGPGAGTYAKWGYYARGASSLGIYDDGTLAPTAAGGSFPFTPQESYAALRAMWSYQSGALYTGYGFYDSFNPSESWIDSWWIGIDQGPILLMIENYRTQLIWNLMKKNPYILQGLREAGFTGGWLS
ncbi:MAG: glucoamylase family protein, partial [Alistipes sp.]|nr:glucoamylase family protein [Alistipes sp.]